MKAARYYGKNDVRVEEIEEPTTRPGTVKIAPAFNGICGSDLHLYHDGPMPPAPTDTTAHPISGETLPVVFGHEFSGVVEEVGEGVTGIAVGDHVAVEPLMVCGVCHACKANKYNLCEKMGFIGISGLGGGLSEHIVVEERWVHKVGEMPLDQAALLEPLAVSLHAVRHAGADAAAGKTAVVGGAGPIGLLAAAVLRAYGLKTIVSEVSPERRAKAQETGVADVVVDPSTEDLAAVVRAETGGAMADFAFDAAGVGVVLDQLFDSLGAGGRLEVIALHTRPYELDVTGKLTMQDRVLGSAIGYANDHAEAIRLVNEGLVNLAPFITSKITVDSIVKDGYEKLLHDRSEVKILVSMS
ncbi:(R,R)-butanediol dehydrogenase/meso-butanediol dehydrogenase/diacetyl reductase [Leucobacter komagatae]|uniref:(R,R)-butanediol dehydrogenase/meso-butanediol dehydrogenase/diacetyl reductase n=1 Tax=Leucobacter komagatae TaxID=55969 RepID=A0A542Y4E3_9MICO|nr:alcohol dehydrogenase catalytic domain-containing protein [Leucobacter komagatae]TQL42928.1 (R,R)-butanediol dehydrogenase/meso-butanediol dehydrogenase/diacetyl reductase [Leucobacter komagatae]